MDNKQYIDIQKDVAVLLKRTKITHDLSIYTPVNVIMGKYLDECWMFECASEECYWDIFEGITTLSNEDYFFIDALTDIELIETYGQNLSYAKAIRNYYSKYENKIYACYTGKNSKNKKYLFGEIDINSVFKQNTKKNNSYLNRLKQSISQLEKNITELKTLDEKETERIEKEIKYLMKSFYKIVNEHYDLDQEYILKDKTTINLSEKKIKSIKKNAILRINAKDICDKIKSTVIGQDEHIERLVYGIIRLEAINKICPDKNKGILLTGSTGVGKTKIISKLEEYFNRPTLTVDSTQLSVPGYVGMSIEDFLQMLYDKCNGNLKEIENAIVIFDEIDKKGSSKNEDVSGKGVLNTLLKFLDGTTYKLKSGATIRTNNMIVIFSGAFSNVYNYKSKNKNKNIGFISENKQEEKEISLDEFMEKAKFPDESMGRFPFIIHLNSLSKDDLVRVLKYSDESDLLIQQKMFNELGLDLIITDDYYEEAALLAYETKTGARALQKIVYESTEELFKYILDNIEEVVGNYDTITIDKNIIKNHNSFKMSSKEEKLKIKENV